MLSSFKVFTDWWILTVPSYTHAHCSLRWFGQISCLIVRSDEIFPLISFIMLDEGPVLAGVPAPPPSCLSLCCVRIFCSTLVAVAALLFCPALEASTVLALASPSLSSLIPCYSKEELVLLPVNMRGQNDCKGRSRERAPQPTCLWAWAALGCLCVVWLGRGRPGASPRRGVVTEEVGTVVCLWLRLHCLAVHSLYLGVHFPKVNTCFPL